MSDNFGENISTLGKHGAQADQFSAEAIANYLDHGAEKDFPNDPVAQAHVANMRLYIGVEENLRKNAPKDDKCRGFLQAYDPENPYGYSGKDGVKETDRFLEKIKSLEKSGTGLKLELSKEAGKEDWSYQYEAKPDTAGK